MVRFSEPRHIARKTLDTSGTKAKGPQPVQYGARRHYRLIDSGCENSGFTRQVQPPQRDREPDFACLDASGRVYVTASPLIQLALVAGL